MTEFFNRKSEKAKRQKLRNNMTAAEIILWDRRKGHQLQGCKFRRQYCVGTFILDFYSAEVKLGIELDGDSHFQEGAHEYDLRRQEYIESFAIKVIRFLNSDIFDNIDSVLEVITREINQRRSPPQPPFARGEKS